MEIDGARRSPLMRLHFAAELVLELFCRALAGADKVGAHISVDKARIDFCWLESISTLLPRISTDANAVYEQTPGRRCTTNIARWNCPGAA